ncbi:MAG: hypothetical protein A3C84_01640 [Candidatus Ryanbacteria bacterium RIFCSPHIGHO2_02_FULL_48_12]|uniref:Uncharacterized protein n=1 Tax=Candidatus Ryanbacteria bacterium RIFCSPHIGHO2_01_FULL_48_27 TaxID=1802115 RepID=A0A1G2G8I0_9BACT|nr:MAG: hypothetical protein A2756_06375 [Candidatus Ryanbacteria bacterium RIFCSPHIGHO2_01_FULL_48_27]OGZ49184.1 MAG: hypothetical protein A3C84_01640 [Candidatus Ryanbacteria bacterium RIFCSPHIGHO2_02_FULL_48_12]
MSNKSAHILLGSLMFVVGAFVLFGNFAHAAEIQYNLLAPLPGGSNQVSGDQAFSTYARQAFAVALSAAAILALLMLVVGGIQYLGSAESPSRLSDAKDRIWNALIGLVLAVAAWLILNTINPALVSNDFNLPSLGGGSTSQQCFCTCNDGSPGTIVTKSDMCTSSCSARGGAKSCSQ